MVNSTTDGVIKTGSTFLRSSLSFTDFTHDAPSSLAWNHHVVLYGAWVGSRLHSWSFEICQEAKACNSNADRSYYCRALSSWLFHTKGMSQLELLGLLFSRIIWCNKTLVQPKTLCQPVACHLQECDCPSPLAQVYPRDRGCLSQEEQPLYSLWLNLSFFNCTISRRQLPEFTHTFIFSTANGSEKGFPL